MSKRPGTQSGEDRDAAARKQMRRTPREGVAIRDDGFTPVRHVLDLISESHPELAPLISKIWEHTANVEMRLNARMGSETASENVNRRIDEQQDEINMIHQSLSEIRGNQALTREDIAKRFTDLTGRDGTNGKVGTLRVSLEKLHSKLWWGVTMIVGGLSGVAVKLIMVGTIYGQMKAEIEADHNQIQLLQQLVFKNQLKAVLDAPGKVP